MIERKAALLIPREFEKTSWYHQIIDNLTRESKDYQTEDIVIKHFYKETESFLVVPRFFPLLDYTYEIIEDNRSKGADININHKITPRNNVQRRAMKFLLENDSGLLQLEPGVGKTVIAINAIATYKKKALIFVHRDALVRQWKREALKFTDLHKHQVAELSSATYENDLKQPIIVSTVQTFLSLLSRNRRDFLKKLNEAGIGIFIGDEVHTTVGARKFSECSLFVPARRVYGLSATPKRWDKTHDIMQYHLGPIYKDEDSEGTVPAKVTVLLLDSGLAKSKTNSFINWSGKFQKSRYLSSLKSSKHFMGVTRIILTKAIRQNYKIVFVSERIKKFLNIAWEWIKHPSKGMFIAGSKDSEVEKDIVFTTPGKMRDGIDVPEKNFLIMTSPISNVSQMCGRCTRSHVESGKTHTIVIDMVDMSYFDISKTLRWRVRYYEEKEWEVQYFAIDTNGKKRQIKRDDAILMACGEEDEWD